MDLKPIFSPHHRSTCFGNKSLAVCLAVIRKKLTQRGLALVARRAKTGLVCRSKKVFTKWSVDSYLVWDQEVACSNHVAPTVCLFCGQHLVTKNKTVSIACRDRAVCKSVFKTYWGKRKDGTLTKPRIHKRGYLQLRLSGREFEIG